MSSTATAHSATEAIRESNAPRRMLVTVRSGDPDESGARLYRHVGFLTCLPDGYEFVYVSPADGIRPLLGFGDVTQRYFSPEMFPLFAERIMSARRPDRARYLQALDLSEDSEPWEILMRSGGRRAGDMIEVLPEPTVRLDGATDCMFLVHGVRHCPNASEAIAELHAGDRLSLRWDQTNPVNPRAVLVLDRTGTELGYVPNPLVEYVQTMLQTASETRLSVVRANGPEVGSHLRLLVRLEGFLPAGFRPFVAPAHSTGA